MGRSKPCLTYSSVYVYACVTTSSSWRAFGLPQWIQHTVVSGLSLRALRLTERWPVFRGTDLLKRLWGGAPIAFAPVLERVLMLRWLLTARLTVLLYIRTASRSDRISTGNRVAERPPAVFYCTAYRCNQNVLLKYSTLCTMQYTGKAPKRRGGPRQQRRSGRIPTLVSIPARRSASFAGCYSLRSV